MQKATASGKNSAATQKNSVAVGPGSSDNSTIGDDGQPVTHASQMPEFKGGQPALLTYLHDHIHYPPLAQVSKIEGTVIVKFVVGKTGKITDVTVMRGIGKPCDDEAVRVVKQMPDWIPAQNEGKVVSFVMTFPISFKLHKEKTN